MATKENRLLKNTNIKIKEGKEKYSMFPYQEEAIKNLEKLDKVYDTYRTLVVSDFMSCHQIAHIS